MGHPYQESDGFIAGGGVLRHGLRFIARCIFCPKASTRFCPNWADTVIGPSTCVFTSTKEYLREDTSS